MEENKTNSNKNQSLKFNFVPDREELLKSKAARLRFRDWILEKILVGVSEDNGMNKDIVLRGAGALHFIYSSPRYSADLDFAVPNFDKDRIMLLDSARKIEFAIDQTPVVPIVRAITDKNLRVAYSDPADLELNGKLELVKDFAGKHISTEKYPGVTVETPDQIYADKLYASLCRMNRRNSIKGTDLFDLEWIANNFPHSKESEKLVERIAQAENYASWSPQLLEKVISYASDRKHHERFFKQFAKSMNPDYFEQQNFNSKYIERSLKHFLSLRKAFKG